MRVLVAWTLPLALAASLSAQEERGEPPEAEQEQQEASEPFVRIYWDEGLRIAGLRQNFAFKIGGMVQNDTAFFSEQSSDEGELGRLENTAAVNWYPTNNARLMANFIRAQRGGVDGIWIFEIRLQWAY